MQTARAPKTNPKTDHPSKPTRRQGTTGPTGGAKGTSSEGTRAPKKSPGQRQGPPWRTTATPPHKEGQSSVRTERADLLPEPPSPPHTTPRGPSWGGVPGNRPNQEDSWNSLLPSLAPDSPAAPHRPPLGSPQRGTPARPLRREAWPETWHQCPHTHTHTHDKGPQGKRCMHKARTLFTPQIQRPRNQPVGGRRGAPHRTAPRPPQPIEHKPLRLASGPPPPRGEATPAKPGHARAEPASHPLRTHAQTRHILPTATRRKARPPSGSDAA